MSPPKSLAAAATASKAGFIKVPRINESCSYCDFLNTLLKEKHNRRVALWSEKEVVDQCFRLQATQQFKLDNSKLKRAMTEPDLEKSRYDWRRLKTSLQISFPKAPAGNAVENLEGLSLPLLTASRGTQSRDLWKELSYEHFAEQLQQKNPDVVLTKITTDSAFRLAVTRTSSKASGRESTITRILGKESTRYWRNK